MFLRICLRCPENFIELSQKLTEIQLKTTPKIQECNTFFWAKIIYLFFILIFSYRCRRSIHFFLVWVDVKFCPLFFAIKNIELQQAPFAQFRSVTKFQPFHLFSFTTVNDLHILLVFYFNYACHNISNYNNDLLNLSYGCSSCYFNPKYYFFFQVQECNIFIFSHFSCY